MEGEASTSRGAAGANPAEVNPPELQQERRFDLFRNIHLDEEDSAAEETDEEDVYDRRQTRVTIDLDEAYVYDPANENIDDPEPLPSTSGLNIRSSDTRIDSDIGEESDGSDGEVRPISDAAFIRRSARVRRRPRRRSARNIPRSQGVRARRPRSIDTTPWLDGDSFQPTDYGFGDDWGFTDNCPLTDESSMSDFFLLFIDENVVNHVVVETNRYYELANQMQGPFNPNSRMGRWKNTTVPEMYSFLAHTLLMPHVMKHRMRDYWSKDEAIVTPFFGKYMARDRYFAISQFLHFTDNAEKEQREHDRIWKVRDVWEMIRSRFSRYFRPAKNVVIDESLILFKGRLIFKIYIKTKRHRFGIKIYVLCDCKTGMVLDVIVYTGTDIDIPSDDPEGHSGAVVKKMMSDYMDKGHVLYTDNFYTSVLLSKYLHNRRTGTVGTVRANRKEMPTFPPTNRGDIILKERDSILAIRWKDKRDITLLSTIHTGRMVDTGKVNRETQEPIMKPDVVIDYTKNMRLVDKSDMQIGSVECVRRTMKWYRKLFFHAIDMSMLNAYNLYKLKHPGRKLYLRVFSLRVVKELLQRFGTRTSVIRGRRMAAATQDRIAPGEWAKRHHLSKVPSVSERHSTQRRCYVCANTTKRPRVTKKVTTWCKECDKGLCMECFVDYHSTLNF